MEDFGRDVKKFLRFHGFKQWQLARQVGLDPTHFSKILSGWFGPIADERKEKIRVAMKELAEQKNA